MSEPKNRPVWPWVAAVFFFAFAGPLSVVYLHRLQALRVKQDGSDAKIYARLLKLKNGDSLESVSAILGSPMADFPRENIEVVKVYQRDMETKPERYPDGVRDGDSFEEFCCLPDGMIWLQFRDQKLINFNIANFRELIDSP